MNTLRKHDLSIWPVYMTQGRRANEQCIIAHIWRFIAKGEEWTLAGLREAAGCTVTKDTLDALVDNGVLCRTDEEDRPNARTCHEYALNYEFLPENRAEPVTKAKAAKKFAGWVFDALKIWARTQGVISPLKVERALAVAVGQHGERLVLGALEKYAAESNPKYNPSPERLAQNIVPWMRKTDTGAGSSRSLGDLE